MRVHKVQGSVSIRLSVFIFPNVPRPECSGLFLKIQVEFHFFEGIPQFRTMDGGNFPINFPSMFPVIAKRGRGHSAMFRRASSPSPMLRPKCYAGTSPAMTQGRI